MSLTCLPPYQPIVGPHANHTPRQLPLPSSARSPATPRGAPRRPRCPQSRSPSRAPPPPGRRGPGCSAGSAWRTPRWSTERRPETGPPVFCNGREAVRFGLTRALTCMYTYMYTATITPCPPSLPPTHPQTQTNTHLRQLPPARDQLAPARAARRLACDGHDEIRQVHVRGAAEPEGLKVRLGLVGRALVGDLFEGLGG